MKIALVIKEFVPSRGGLERYGDGLARTMVSLGHEVHVWTTRFPEKIPAGVACHRIESPAWWQWPAPTGVLTKMREAVSNHGCDTLLALSPFYPADVYRPADGVQAHWMRIKYPGRWLRWCAQHLPRRLAIHAIERNLYQPHNCRRIVTNSQMVKNLVRRYYDFPGERIHVVHNGVDLNTFAPGDEQGRIAWRRQWQIAPDTSVVLFVGNDWLRKGLGFLLRGARPMLQNNQFALVVAGRGDVDKWRSLAQKLGIGERVMFVGASSRVVEWYRAADILVLPTRYDPFANVTLEAMACGLPVITTADNGAAELISHGQSGYVLSTRSEQGDYDIGELESYLAALLSPDARAKMGKLARAVASQYTLQRNAEATLAVCQASIATDKM